MQTTPVDIMAAKMPTRTNPEIPTGKYDATSAAYALLPSGMLGMSTFAVMPMTVAPRAMSSIDRAAQREPCLETLAFLAAKQRV